MKKNFTFTNLLKNKRATYFTLTIVLTIILFIIFFLIKEVITFTVFIIFEIFFIIYSIRDIKKLIVFIKNYSEKDLKKLEQELNNSIYIDNDWFLTENYLFYLKKYTFIDYQDIFKITSKTIFNKIGKTLRLEYKIILHTTKNETLIYRTFTKEYNDDFISALKLKNPNILES